MLGIGFLIYNQSCDTTTALSRGASLIRRIVKADIRAENKLQISFKPQLSFDTL
jgi:hypothetical protein